MMKKTDEIVSGHYVPDVQDLGWGVDDSGVGAPEKRAGEEHLHIADGADLDGDVLVLEQGKAVQIR